MRSRTLRSFWQAYGKLPSEIKQSARSAYAQFAADPSHPNLRFKRVHSERPIYSARITRGYRAVGLLEGETITWIWIGGHDEYDRLLGKL